MIINCTKDLKKFYKWDGSATNWEIMYLENIGKFKEKNPNKFTRLEMLKKYKSAAERRTKWGNIDKEKVFEYLNKTIAEMEG